LVRDETTDALQQWPLIEIVLGNAHRLTVTLLNDGNNAKAEGAVKH
jgi:hypothetical protein